MLPSGTVAITLLYLSLGWSWLDFARDLGAFCLAPAHFASLLPPPPHSSSPLFHPCSGATESNNMAIKGVARFYKRKKNHIITTMTEHKCVLDSCRMMEQEGYEVTYLPVQSSGLIDMEASEWTCALLAFRTPFAPSATVCVWHVLEVLMHGHNGTSISAIPAGYLYFTCIYPPFSLHLSLCVSITPCLGV